MFLLLHLLFYSMEPIATRDAMFQVIYANVSPYIVVDQHKNATGIVPDIFEFAELFCHDALEDVEKYDHVFEYNSEIKSITRINDLLNSDVAYGEGEIENATSDFAFWFPILETIDVHSYKNIKKRNLSLHHVSYLEEMVVITSEQRIHLIEKVGVGLEHCYSVAVLACVGAICFALLVWFLERFSSHADDFSPSFLKGFGTGAWLSVVTMGTVGYGDVTPKSCPGRVVAFFWMMVSVVLASVMTATISETVHGVSSLTLHNETIVGIAHTPEENIAKHDYHATWHGVESIQDMIDMLENHTVRFGLLNADIASYYQDNFLNANHGDDSIEQLVYIYGIDVKVPVEFLVNMNNPIVKKYIDCFDSHRNEIVPSILAKYKKHLRYETLHHIKITKLFKQYPVLGYVSASLVGCIIIGLVFEFHSWFTKSKNMNNRY